MGILVDINQLRCHWQVHTARFESVQCRHVGVPSIAARLMPLPHSLHVMTPVLQPPQVGSGPAASRTQSRQRGSPWSSPCTARSEPACGCLCRMRRSRVGVSSSWGNGAQGTQGQRGFQIFPRKYMSYQYYVEHPPMTFSKYPRFTTIFLTDNG